MKLESREVNKGEGDNEGGKTTEVGKRVGYLLYRTLLSVFYYGSC